MFHLILKKDALVIVCSYRIKASQQVSYRMAARLAKKEKKKCTLDEAILQQARNSQYNIEHKQFWKLSSTTHICLSVCIKNKAVLRVTSDFFNIFLWIL